jgi:hypothetical protein
MVFESSGLVHYLALLCTSPLDSWNFLLVFFSTNVQVRWTWKSQNQNIELDLQVYKIF